MYIPFLSGSLEYGANLNFHVPTLVLAITPVDTVDEAIELANDSEYTLVASLWTTNVHKAFDVGARIRAGEALNDLTVDSTQAFTFSRFFRHS